ncbi:MAG: hypothetical protein WCV62_04205 [Candidatus Peribacteraceae bacterium]|jgi:hypothetical protein
MTPALLAGIAGSVILLLGAALPERRFTQPVRSLKNWLFAVGGLFMFAYAFLNWRAGGPVFFVFLQILVNGSSVFMMLNTRDTIDTPVMVIASLAFVAWSLFLFEGLSTVFFIIGLCGLSVGYVMETGTVRRAAALTIGGALIALFSYVVRDWVFLWLNVFYALLSGYQTWRLVYRAGK